MINIILAFKTLTLYILHNNFRIDFVLSLAANQNMMLVNMAIQKYADKEPWLTPYTDNADIFKNIVLLRQGVYEYSPQISAE